MSSTPRTYATPWPWNQTPHVGSTIQLGSNATAVVTQVTDTLIVLDNGRAFNR